MRSDGSAAAKRLTLLACILGSGIALLDSTIVNVALPSIERSLGGGLAAQQWVANAYLLTLGSLILVGGSLGDVFGERRVFAIGVTGFGVASLLCALAPSIDALIVARALQGIAGALLVPSALAVIVATFSASERGPAIGSWAAWSGIATVIGPLAGGEILNAVSWRWIFLVNLPFVAICVALILAYVPSPQAGPRTRRIDVFGAALGALGLGGPVFAMIEQPRLGWGSPGVIAPLAAGACLLIAFLRWERNSADPMLPLSLFARRNFSVGNFETFVVYAGLSVLIFFLTLFLQQVCGYTPLQSGLATLPVTIVMFALSRRVGALADRLGPRLFMGGGPLLAAVGLFLLRRVDAPTSYVSDLLPALLIFSLGLALTVAPLTTAVLAGAEASSAGIASAVNNAIARVAGLLATAAVGVVVASSFDSGFDSRLRGRTLSAAAHKSAEQARHLSLGLPSTHGVPGAEAHALTAAARAASVGSFHLAITIAACLVAIGGIAGVLGIRNPRADVAADPAGGVSTTPGGRPMRRAPRPSGAGEG
ncbi:MAG TPA: DHA2 family efflux MFS transporter permease subunit [Solirubrobacteraceae bacterium]|jgi:EmrB/QacA subfamily drug resistance transporter